MKYLSIQRLRSIHVSSIDAVAPRRSRTRLTESSKASYPTHVAAGTAAAGAVRAVGVLDRICAKGEGTNCNSSAGGLLPVDGVRCIIGVACGVGRGSVVEIGGRGTGRNTRTAGSLGSGVPAHLRWEGSVDRGLIVTWEMQCTYRATSACGKLTPHRTGSCGHMIVTHEAYEYLRRGGYMGAARRNVDIRSATHRETPQR
jgi:hypothetical protein